MRSLAVGPSGKQLIGRCRLDVVPQITQGGRWHCQHPQIVHWLPAVDIGVHRCCLAVAAGWGDPA